MKWLLLFTILSIPSVRANIIGETIDEAYPDRDTYSVEKLDGKSTDRIVYRVTQPRFPKHHELVVVSTATGKIFGYTHSRGFPTIYEAVQHAAHICEGEVFMPTSATQSGFILRNEPGEKYAGKIFRIVIKGDFTASQQSWSLDIDCHDFQYPHRVNSVPSKQELDRRAKREKIERLLKINRTEKLSRDETK